MLKSLKNQDTEVSGIGSNNIMKETVGREGEITTFTPCLPGLGSLALGDVTSYTGHGLKYSSHPEGWFPNCALWG